MLREGTEAFEQRDWAVAYERLVAAEPSDLADLEHPDSAASRS